MRGLGHGLAQRAGGLAANVVHRLRSHPARSGKDNGAKGKRGIALVECLEDVAQAVPELAAGFGGGSERRT